MATITEKQTRRNKKTQLLRHIAPPTTRLTLSSLLLSLSLSFTVDLCVFICGILRIYLFWHFFYNIPTEANIQPEPIPLSTIRLHLHLRPHLCLCPRPHTTAIWVLPIAMPPPSTSAVPSPSNAVATSVTRFSLFPFQFFRCVYFFAKLFLRCSLF